MCGDYRRVGDEVCDDGNADSLDGCTSDCRTVESGYLCSGGGSSTGDRCTEICGDGVLFSTSSSLCDDGNTASGEGCSSSCYVEVGWSCTKRDINPASLCAPICGDRRRISIETCDDGNSRALDGCSSTCQVEPGWTCTHETSSYTSDKCTETCGDGYVGSASDTKLCDDGNTSNGDGCSSTCEIEDGYLCTEASAYDGVNKNPST